MSMKPSVVTQWEKQQKSPARRALERIWGEARRPVRLTLLVAAGAYLGLHLAAAAPRMAVPDAELRERLHEANVALHARQGELELLRLEMNRLGRIMDYSSRYRIPADLARAIHDIALAEGVDPDIAFRLVQVESGFTRTAVSPVGAVGLAQVMPRTAYELDPTLSYRDLFDRETNLHLGFRYLRLMIERYNGDLRLALLAYNRGPGTVDRIRRAGGDPENGYSIAVLGAD
jgi:soluble lytic murein transglycosylase-like protein